MNGDKGASFASVGGRFGWTGRALTALGAAVLSLSVPLHAAAWQQTAPAEPQRTECSTLFRVPDPPAWLPTNDQLWQIVDAWDAQTRDVQNAASWRFAELLQLCQGSWISMEVRRVAGQPRLADQVWLTVNLVYSSDSEPGGEREFSLRLPPRTLRPLTATQLRRLFSTVAPLSPDAEARVRDTVLSQLKLGQEFDLTLMRDPSNNQYVIDGFVYGHLRLQGQWDTSPVRIAVTTGKVTKDAEAPPPRDAIERAKLNYVNYLFANDLKPEDVTEIRFNLGDTAIVLAPHRADDTRLPGSVPDPVDQMYAGFPWRLSSKELR